MWAGAYWTGTGYGNPSLGDFCALATLGAVGEKKKKKGKKKGGKREKRRFQKEKEKKKVKKKKKKKKTFLLEASQDLCLFKISKSEIF